MDALPRPTAVFALLAEPQRIEILAMLARSDMRPAEIASALKLQNEPLQSQLAQLIEAGLVLERRSDANPNDRYYQLAIPALREQLKAAIAAIHPALLEQDEAPAPAITEQPPRVLFLCTRNSARSQMAEALLRVLSGGQIAAYSAGTLPDSVNPTAIETMRDMQIDISDARSKHLDEYLDQPFDYVITVCDNAREVCPNFPGAADAAHWSIPDPAIVEDAGERRRAFGRVATQLTTRIRFLITAIQRERQAAASS